MTYDIVSTLGSPGKKTRVQETESERGLVFLFISFAVQACPERRFSLTSTSRAHAAIVRISER